MIFENKKNYNSNRGEFTLHLLIFFSISLNLLSSSPIIDFTLLTCMIIYLTKVSNITWYFSILIFLWGIYSDLLIGYSVGYSCLLFLFFLTLNQISNLIGIYNINIIKFIVFFIGILLIVLIEYLFIFLKFNTNISVLPQVLKIVFVPILYLLMSYFIENYLNIYASKK